MQPQPPPIPDNPDAEPLLTPDEFKAIVTRMGRNTNRFNDVSCVAIGAYALAFWVGTLWQLRSGAEFFWYWMSSVAVVHTLLTRLFAYRIRKDNNEAERLVRFLEKTQDARLLGTILNLYSTKGHPGEVFSKIQDAANATIARLLPLLQPTDADTLNTQQRERLRSSLFYSGVLSEMGHWAASDFCLPLLCALEQIGDKRDLPDIERLLNDKTLTDEVRIATEHCAQIIRERLAREEGRDVLLRADRKPEAVATLLRPSVETADTPPQQLLRAATSDAHDPPA